MEIRVDKYEIDSAPWTVEGLIGVAERIMAAEPRLFSHPDSETGKDLNVRLIRDYIVREFIPRPERLGRESRFGRDHLIWLLAVRGLLRSQRWSLPAIKTSFKTTSTDELLSGLLAPVRSLIDAEYRKATRQIGERPTTAIEALKTPELNPAQLLIEQFKSKKSTAVRETQAPLFSRIASASRPASISREMMASLASLQRLHYAVKERTHIEIEPWCEVVMDARRVQSLTVEEVEHLGEALKSHLRTEMARRRK
jgi:hypothetical protein